ncbi:MAG: hypothetical protein KDC66_12115 [Phaeodactylibacter sp.]|nr:hypothetical protein [Phaeodactylibacter sp.]MCB9274234.1 hypothetical protein [Lewinellaceae bacterium]
MPSFHQDFQTIQVLADEVQNSDDFESALANFLRFSGEMRAWLADNFYSSRIKGLVNQMPEIEYDSQPSLWSKLSGGGGIGMYKNFRKREDARLRVRETAKLFRAIYPLACDEMDSGLV